MLNTSARGVRTTLPSPMSKAGTSLPRPTASLAMTRGTDILSRRAASGLSEANHRYGAAYTAKVRIAVRAGSLTITREGCGSGEAKAPSPGEAHELALKAAETDATKRALATFGNPFGLALYDRELTGVKNRKALVPAQDEYRGPWLLSLPNGAGQSFDKSNEFIAALRQALTDAADIEQLFAIWERNVDTVRAINKQTNRSTPRGVVAPNLVAHMKARAIALAKQAVKLPRQHPTIRTGRAQRWTKASSPSRAEARAIEGTPTLRSQPTLPYLRTNPCPCTSHSLCATKGFGTQSQR